MVPTENFRSPSPTAFSFSFRVYRLSVSAIHCKQRISHNRCYKTCLSFCGTTACFTIERKEKKERQAVKAEACSPQGAVPRLPALCEGFFYLLFIGKTSPLSLLLLVLLLSLFFALGEHHEDKTARGGSPSLSAIVSSKSRCDLRRHFRLQLWFLCVCVFESVRKQSVPLGTAFLPHSHREPERTGKKGREREKLVE